MASRVDRTATIAQIVAEHGQAAEVFPGAEGQAQGGNRRESRLIKHIVDHHHANERRALPYIVSLLGKVAGRHRERNAQLDVLCDLGHDLADTLDTYMEEEERTLLPALAAGGCDVVREEMSRHNRELSLLLTNIRALADGYVAPDWGDRSYQALMEELEALEDDLTERMHVDNLVLIQPTS
jgi:iron-sulfur cluster repair protein YtfE (RIC family)